MFFRRPRRTSSPSATPLLSLAVSESTISPISVTPAVGPRSKTANRCLVVGFFRPDSELGVRRQLRARFAMATAIRMITNFAERKINAAADAKLPKGENFPHSVAAVFRNFGRSPWPKLSPEPFRGRSTSLRPADSGRGYPSPYDSTHATRQLLVHHRPKG